MGKLICGKNSVLDAIRLELPITKLCLMKPLSFKIDSRIKVKICSKNELNKMIQENHQGYVAELKEFNYYTLDDVLNDKPNKLLILDHIQDPHNFGAILRTANAAGITHVMISKNRQVEVTPTVIKVSSGGYINVKIVRVNSLTDAIIKLKKANYWIYASALDEDSTPIKEVIFNAPSVIVVGNESKGVNNSILKLADQKFYIPMSGTVQSLNVSVATGIILFHS